MQKVKVKCTNPNCSYADTIDILTPEEVNQGRKQNKVPIKPTCRKCGGPVRKVY